MTYKMYIISSFFKDADKVPAQLLYDWRDTTGFMSRDELRDVFRGLVGEPAPSGYQQIPLEKFQKFAANHPEFVSRKNFHTVAMRYDESLNIKTLQDVEQLRKILKRYANKKL